MSVIPELSRQGKDILSRDIKFERYRKPSVIEYPKNAIVLNPRHTQQQRKLLASAADANEADAAATEDGAAGRLARIGKRMPPRGVRVDDDDPLYTPEEELLCDDERLRTVFLKLRWTQIGGQGCGLENAGNVCFANAVLQAFAYTPAIAQFFMSYFRAPDAQTTAPYDFGFALAEAIRMIHGGAMGSSSTPASGHSTPRHGGAGKRVPAGGCRIARPSAIIGNLRLLSPHFKLGRQSDAHEFAVQLLHACQRSLVFRQFRVLLPGSDGRGGAAGPAKISPAIQHTTALMRICGGFLRSQVAWSKEDEIQMLHREGKRQAAIDLEMDHGSASAATRDDDDDDDDGKVGHGRGVGEDGYDGAAYHTNGPPARGCSPDEDPEGDRPEDRYARRRRLKMERARANAEKAARGPKSRRRQREERQRREAEQRQPPPAASGTTLAKAQLVSNTYDPFTILNVDVVGHSLEDCLAHFCAREELDGRIYRSPRGVLVHATKQFHIHSPPNVLIVHLKRFTSSGAKINKVVAYPTTLDLAPYCSAEYLASYAFEEVRAPCASAGRGDRGSRSSSASASMARFGGGPVGCTERHAPLSHSLLYELNAVVVHEGRSIQYGHYYSVVRARNGVWLECNDEVVTASSEQRAMACQAYMLMYSRIPVQRHSGAPGGAASGRGSVVSSPAATPRPPRTPSDAAPFAEEPCEVGVEVPREAIKALLHAKKAAARPEAPRPSAPPVPRDGEAGGSGDSGASSLPRSGRGGRAGKETASRSSGGCDACSSAPPQSPVAATTHAGRLVSGRYGAIAAVFSNRSASSPGVRAAGSLPPPSGHSPAMASPSMEATVGRLRSRSQSSSSSSSSDNDHDESGRSDAVVGTAVLKALRDRDRANAELRTVARPRHAPAFSQRVRDADWEMEMDRGRQKKVRQQSYWDGHGDEATPGSDGSGRVNRFQESGVLFDSRGRRVWPEQPRDEAAVGRGREMPRFKRR